MGKKLNTLVWRVVAKYWGSLEDFRIWSSLQVVDQTSKTMNRTRI